MVQGNGDGGRGDLLCTTTSEIIVPVNHQTLPANKIYIPGIETHCSVGVFHGTCWRSQVAVFLR